MMTVFKITLLGSLAVFLAVNVVGFVKDVRKRKEEKKNAKAEKNPKTVETETQN